MKAYSIRLYNKEELLDEVNQFTKQFRKEEIDHNHHYLVNGKGLVVQLNTESKHIGCHDVGFKRLPLHKLQLENIKTIIKNASHKGLKFELNIDVDDDEDADYYYRYDLQIMTLGDDKVEEYIVRLEECYEELRGNLRGITVRDKEYNYEIDFYISGASYVQTYRRGEDMEGDEILNIYLQLYGLAEDNSELQHIEMQEYEIVEHPYSKLYVLLEYLQANKESFPEEVGESLRLAEGNLQRLADTHRDANTYKK